MRYATVFARKAPFFFLALTALPGLTGAAGAQPSDKPAVTQLEPDTLLFKNGERLIGTLKRSTGVSVVFHSDMAGDVTVDWSKVTEVRSHQRFAVVPKGVNLLSEESASKVPQGTISVMNDKVQLHLADQSAAVEVPLSQTADVIDAATYDKVVLRNPAWYERWRGAATAGLGLVNATQQSQNYTSSIALVRALPGEDWMNPENRTSLNFTSTYGTLLQPKTPEVKTSIFHADAERDHYFRPSLFVFGEAAFDHDYSLGLDLEQTYGAGLGWTLHRSATRQLDIKAQIAYIDQQFSASAQNQHLLSSVFSENYTHNFPKKMAFHESIAVSPAWTNLHAYSATGNASLTIPVIKRIAYTAGVLDTFLNNPSPGFRKNSFQFTSGITYVIP